jgi:hypothetical protein
LELELENYVIATQEKGQVVNFFYRKDSRDLFTLDGHAQLPLLISLALQKIG